MRQLTFFILFMSLFVFEFSSANNSELLQRIVNGAVHSESDSLVIIQNNKIVYSNFFNKQDEVRSVQSITKSICAIAIGILLDKGNIKNLDQFMTEWIPEWSSDIEKSKITLRMIMNHTSGLPDIRII